MIQITTNCGTNKIAQWSLLKDWSTDISGGLRVLTGFKTSRGRRRQDQKVIEERHTLLVTYRRKTTVLQPSIENTQPACIWLQGEEALDRGNVDHERLRSYKHSLPSQDIETVSKRPSKFHNFLFPSLGQDCRKRGNQGSRSIVTTYTLWWNQSKNKTTRHLPYEEQQRGTWKLKESTTTKASTSTSELWTSQSKNKDTRHLPTKNNNKTTVDSRHLHLERHLRLFKIWKQ
jgi:hypothetical protein